MEEEKEITFSINKKQLFIVVACFLLFTFSGFLLYRVRFLPKVKNFVVGSVISKKIENATSTTLVIPVKDLVRRKIDGVFVEKGKENIFPFAVMIDNHVDAQPQSGLSRANIVYEAEAEGGITRFLAVFASDENIEEIGPVRSARSYYIDWASEYNSLYVHCGGSPEALAQIIKDDIFDLNQFYHGGDFWRDNNRPAPHNLMTSSSNLKKYIEKKKETVGDYDGWLWKNDDISSSSSKQIKDITIGYSGDFTVLWKYDIIKNIYYRYTGGKRATDKQAGEIKAKNLIIQTISSQVIDEKKRLKLDDVGRGRAIICLDGSCKIGEWQKNKKSSRSKFYYQNGDEVKFNAGQTWLEIVRPTINVNF